MKQISYRRHRFPGSIIQHTVWLYFRFPLSYRDIEDLLSERGIEVTYETIRRWALKFGLGYARSNRIGIHSPGRGAKSCGLFVCVAHSRDFVTAPLGCEREPSQSTWNLSSAVK